MKQARLSIYIKGKPIKQGKFYYDNKKPVFLVNITDNKWWTTYGGYSISCQILESFSKASLRGIKIIYKHPERGMLYITNQTRFKKKGIFVDLGNHDQIVLPVQGAKRNWEIIKGKVENEPFGLPLMSVGQWLKTNPENKKLEDCSMPAGVFMDAFKKSGIKRYA